MKASIKARIKATGEIIEVIIVGTLNGNRYRRTDGQNELYESKDLDLNIEAIINPDYWTRFEHQAAIATMGGICGNASYSESSWEDMAEDAIRAAHALVQKLKEKEERK